MYMYSHEHASPSEDWAGHLKVHISIDVHVVTLVAGLQLGSFVPTINREENLFMYIWHSKELRYLTGLVLSN